jgi:RNA polymerase-interacting CarD/CdnL/TRCF family regulator
MNRKKMQEMSVYMIADKVVKRLRWNAEMGRYELPAEDRFMLEKALVKFAIQELELDDKLKEEWLGSVFKESTNHQD